MVRSSTQPTLNHGESLRPTTSQLDASPSVSHRAIADVVVGRRDYDDLTGQEQAVVRAEWSERITERREGLDPAETFSRTPRPGATCDAVRRAKRRPGWARRGRATHPGPPRPIPAA
ncbi:hypothetical protein EEB14_10735 [Rhodococcus sp. WS4]|nr:hypothetical protein EEB14_10735 [Rhodococcus sp. WS4]